MSHFEGISDLCQEDAKYVDEPKGCESGSKGIPRNLLWGKRANGEHYYSLWIEDSPEFTAVSFNLS
jgi:hypothetical protein